MTASQQKGYSILRNGDLLVFRTAHFTEGTGSLLHSGIYNRELASVLSAGAVLTVAALFFIIIKLEKVLVSFFFSLPGAFIILIMFTGLFVFFKVFIFRERELIATLNRETGQAEILAPAIFRKKKSIFSLREIRNVFIETRRTEILNADAVQFVEKISAQHGMVVPGLGDEKVLFVLKLITDDGSNRTLYADNNMEDTMAAHEEIKEFLGLA